MVIESQNNLKEEIGSLVKKCLIQSNIEKRIVIGLSQISQFLVRDNLHIPIFCLMSAPRTGDYATHMHEVLLKAYCLEHDIYIIEIDNAEKLNRILGTSKLESCVLICANPAGDGDCEGSFLDQDYQLTKVEKKIVNFCEDHWDGEKGEAMIRLPEK